MGSHRTSKNFLDLGECSVEETAVQVEQPLEEGGGDLAEGKATLVEALAALAALGAKGPGLNRITVATGF